MSVLMLSQPPFPSPSLFTPSKQELFHTATFSLQETAR